mgnify:CR=1 FL=1
MFVREDLNEKSLQEVQEMLENDLANYKAVVESMSIVDVEEAETELIEKMEEYDKYLSEIQYELPTEVIFDGTKFTRNKVGNMVCYFIEKQEVDWQYTLGLYQMSKLWKNLGSTIGYKEYDSSLRVLGSMKFKGSAEWKDILVINEFMGKVHDVYTLDTSYMIYLSKMHNELINKLQPIEVPAQEA